MIGNQKKHIRIKLKTYDKQLLDLCCNKIIDTTKRTNTKTIGPIPLPKKRRIYCVLRSPHVDKDSREHFELKTYSRLIGIKEPSSQTIDFLMKLNIPAGVDIEIKL
uniref:30S ribosomal protein S10, chloroplastic n=1 Tax=Gayliella sp. TaxID=2575623 RepID=A0A4D6WT11_9FLOR|nr:ribosomal protein S10 [Gayliella sp.]